MLKNLTFKVKNNNNENDTFNNNNYYYYYYYYYFSQRNDELFKFVGAMVPPMPHNLAL